jgi:hypothetical protein
MTTRRLILMLMGLALTGASCILIFSVHNVGPHLKRAASTRHSPSLSLQVYMDSSGKYRMFPFWGVDEHFVESAQGQVVASILLSPREVVVEKYWLCYQSTEEINIYVDAMANVDAISPISNFMICTSVQHETWLPRLRPFERSIINDLCSNAGNVKWKPNYRRLGVTGLALGLFLIICYALTYVRSR